MFTATVLVTHNVELHVPSALKKYVVLTDGAVVILNPVFINVPPQEPSYQYQFAPAPSVPPYLITDIADPEHTVAGLIFNESADTEFVINDIIVLLQPVVLHDPCALT